ncbi:hypothetical protein G7Y89_g6516 [Cudoniella acicularis]|uniref:WSC domain-containing protein n=1 Tax=Cudoniella acicularis TaxID=354080 RepID=A0A8H4RMT9_9HELO|nr:hypothetical protein G7Y89_g6516 [Cudoniella acicularis]
MASTPAGYTSLGCYADSATRLLTRPSTEDIAITIDVCEAYCSNTNTNSSNQFYPIFGVEDGSQCFCGKGYTRSIDGQQIEDACTESCSGNQAEMCGAVWFINIYSYTATTISAGVTLWPTSSGTISSTAPVATVTTTATQGPTATGAISTVASPNTSPAVIALGVIAGLLALALLGILGSLFLRARKRRPVTQIGPPEFQNSYESKYTAGSLSHIRFSELGQAEVPYELSER